jgi:integrase
MRTCSDTGSRNEQPTRTAVGEIQTLLGHSTLAMARRYAGQALNRQGAKLMVQYSPLS